MATAIDTGHRVFTLGSVFSRGFGVMGGAATTVFGLSFIFSAIPQAIWGYIMPSFLVGVTPADFARIYTVSILGGVIMMALSLIVQGALVKVVTGHAEGRSVPLSDCIAIGVRKALPLLGLTILAFIGCMIGFILLVVPGIILALMWCVAGPALVDEGLGVIESFGRSRYLTKGARWKIFGLFLLLLVIMWIGMLVVGLVAMATGGAQAAVMAMSGQNPTILMTVVGLIFNTLFTGFWATLLTALFVELRNWKDGLDPGNLEEVFS